MSPDSQASRLPPQTMECHGEHPSSKIKSLHPAMPQGLLDAALNRLFKAIVILMLSVSSISTYNFFPGDATCNLPVSWPQLLTSFTPGDRSAQMRGTFTVTGQMVLLVSLLNASAKMAAGSFVAASSYTNDGTALALESHLLPHFLVPITRPLHPPKLHLTRHKLYANDIFRILMPISTSPSPVILLFTTS